MKKKNISPEKAKLISTFLISIIFMAIVLSISRMHTQKLLKDAEQEYFSNLNTSLDGFTKIINIQLDNYINNLKTFYIDEVFSSCNTEEIVKFLKKNNYKKHEDFIDIYYLTPDGTAYLSNGKTVYMDINKHKSISDKIDLFISGMCLTSILKENFFCIEKDIYDKDGNIAGAIGASVNIDRFAERITEVQVGSKESFMIIDKEGIFLVHPRADVIGLKYIPSDPQYIDTSSENLAKSAPSTFISQADNGEEIYLTTSKIPLADWTISLKVSINEINTIFLPEKKNEFLIVLFSIIIILLLTVIEERILDFFQKKQLIATFYDPLTNLWTRQRFEIEATKMMRNSHAKFMLIEADIRGFKFINQNYGEEAADKLILFFSKALNNYITEHHGILGRGFADHFYALIKVQSVHKAMNFFKEETGLFIESLKSYEIPFFPKFGVSFLIPGQNKDKDISIQTLIGQASFAKSTIKDNLLTHYSIYNSKLLEKINEERYIENHMQQALDAHEFFVMYQPKISLSDDKIVGAEALVRWNSPKLGRMTPDKFIPLFERNGFITKLDYYVYEEVFKFIQSQLAKGVQVVPISVNMSRNHNKPEKFMHDFMEIFNKYSIPPQMIQVEILERSVMDNRTLQVITEKLHSEGFSVAMDDFGSGESSLNMLTKIPVDVLKFDRAFLNASTDADGKIDKKSEKFIHILIDLSKNLEKQTVFEGVETQAQRDFLRSIECDQAQGFFYSRPLSEQDFVEFIKLHS